MFEMMNAEKMKSTLKDYGEESDIAFHSLKPVQIKSTFVDRALITLGQMLITTGLKLKYRQHTRLATDEVHSPNFLIML